MERVNKSEREDNGACKTTAAGQMNYRLWKTNKKCENGVNEFPVQDKHVGFPVLLQAREKEMVPLTPQT